MSQCYFSWISMLWLFPLCFDTRQVAVCRHLMQRKFCKPHPSAGQLSASEDAMEQCPRKRKARKNKSSHIISKCHVSLHHDKTKVDWVLVIFVLFVLQLVDVSSWLLDCLPSWCQLGEEPSKPHVISSFQLKKFLLKMILTYPTTIKMVTVKSVKIHNIEVKNPFKQNHYHL